MKDEWLTELRRAIQNNRQSRKEGKLNVQIEEEERKEDPLKTLESISSDMPLEQVCLSSTLRLYLYLYRYLYL